jgi:hypothetical protein
MTTHRLDRVSPPRQLTAAARIIVVAGAVLMATGCNRSPPVVEGMVTLDGAPIDAGVIELIPADGRGPTAGTGITAGRYRTEAPEGVKQVRIRSPQKDGTQMLDPGGSGQMVDRRVESIPARYNEKTEIEVTIKPGLNKHDFTLEGSMLGKAKQ